MSTVYTADVTREGKWWLVRIPEINGLTQARRLSEVELMAREYIAATLGLELDSVEVQVSLGSVAGIDVDGRVATMQDARQRAASLEQTAASTAVALAQDLAAAKVPLRDIGTVLGVSFQRADQLVKSSR